MKRYQAEMKALNAALSAHLARPPEPTPPPVLPDVDTLVEALRPPIIASIREEIGPLFTEVRSEVETLLERRTQELSMQLVAKLSLVLKTQKAIQEWMEREVKGQNSSQNGKSVSPHTSVTPGRERSASTRINGPHPVVPTINGTSHTSDMNGTNGSPSTIAPDSPTAPPQANGVHPSNGVPSSLIPIPLS